jgi:hypothetical protein
MLAIIAIFPSNLEVELSECEQYFKEHSPTGIYTVKYLLQADTMFILFLHCFGEANQGSTTVAVGQGMAAQQSTTAVVAVGIGRAARQ